MLSTLIGRWRVAGIAACLLLAFAGWYFVVSPQREGAGAEWEELAVAQTQTGILRSRVVVLQKRFEQIEQARADLAVTRQAIPAGNDLDTLVLALEAAGAATGVTIDAVTPGPPIDITPVAPKPKPVESGDEDSGVAAAPQATPAASWPLFVLPVTIRASGSMADVQRFLQHVQFEQPRAILFTSFALTPGGDGSTFAGQVVLSAETRVFVGPVLATDIADAAVK